MNGVERLKSPRDKKIFSFGKRASTKTGFRKVVFAGAEDTA
jgi:hypothetical protein